MGDIGIGVLIFAAALLYSSVGHAGGSGYLAALALGGVPPASMKPTALTLNVLVATIATWKFVRAGCFSWRAFWPFALASVPCAYLGGRMTLPATLYRPLVAVVLLFAAYRLLAGSRAMATATTRPPPLPLALVVGGGIGLLAGMTGHGGGVFLSPFLVLMGWAEVRQSAGIAAAFILVNSIAGLAGHASSLARLPEALPGWALAAVVGGTIGSEYGSRRLGTTALRRLLAVVLALAGLKMIVAT